MAMVMSLPREGVDMALYGQKSLGLQNYIRNQIQNFANPINEYAQRMYNSLVNTYNFYTDSFAQMGLKRELQQQGIAILDNYFEELLSFEDIQNANLTMQRWIMANPNVRQLHLEQNIDGYSETYNRVDITGHSDNDYDYRRVMNGVIRDTGEDTWVSSRYHEDLLPGDRELDHMEKVTILNTWAASDIMLKTCDFDFTCSSETPVKINK